MSIFYVSSNGCDENTGLTPETAWKTVEKVNSSLCAGDTAKFRCGDIFYGSLKLPHGQSENCRTQVTSYGEGAKPVISQYKKAKACGWEKYADGIFRLDLTNIDNFCGNTIDMDCGVGFIKVSGKIYYKNRPGLEDLCDPWDFFNDGKYVYIKQDICPADLSDDILFACNIKMIQPRNFIEIIGISFLGTGGHGCQGVMCGTHISDCDFCEIGGSFMYNEHGQMTRTRYGNGFECWTDSKNVLVENCHFSDIYDVAMSIQGWKCTTNWENIVFRNNTIFRCTQAFEIWTKTEERGTGIVNCSFENNICSQSGYGWGYLARPDKDQACHLLMYHRECDICDMRIHGNTFIDARNCVIFKNGGAAELPHDYKIYDNTIIHSSQKPIVFRWGGTDENDYTLYEKEIIKNNRYFEIPDFEK